MKREAWGIIASISIVVLLIGVVIILAFTGGGLKAKIAAKYSILTPGPQTMADSNFEKGYSGLGYDREAALDAKIAFYNQINNIGATDAELQSEMSKQLYSQKDDSVIAYVDGTPVLKSGLELALLQQNLNYQTYIAQYNSEQYAEYRKDDPTRLKMKEALSGSVLSEADLMYTVIGETAVLNEAKKQGLAMSPEDAKNSALQNLQSGTATPEGLGAYRTFLNEMGISEDTFLEKLTTQIQEGTTKNNLFNAFIQVLPQEMQQDQNSVYSAWNTYVNSLVEKASVTLV